MDGRQRRDDIALLTSARTRANQKAERAIARGLSLNALCAHWNLRRISVAFLACFNNESGVLAVPAFRRFNALLTPALLGSVTEATTN